jgi:integration host factor subunit alpha
MTLTKEELVNAIAEANGSPRNRSVELVEILLELIKSKLAAGEDVLISGFGKFCVKEKRQRRGRNPATGDEMMLDARRLVTFKCSGQLREKINQLGDNVSTRALIILEPMEMSLAQKGTNPQWRFLICLASSCCRMTGISWVGATL